MFWLKTNSLHYGQGRRARQLYFRVHFFTGKHEQSKRPFFLKQKKKKTTTGGGGAGKVGEDSQIFIFEYLQKH